MRDEIQQAAQALIAAFGDKAAAIAEERVKKLKEDQIHGPAVTWRRIANAVRLLEAAPDR